VDLQIELTDYCNVKCIYCSQHMDTGVHPGYKKGMMSYSNFKKIIDDFESLSIGDPKHIVFQWLGESTSHPKFSKFMKYVLDKNEKNNFLNNVSWVSNVITLDVDTVKLMCEISNKFTEIHFELSIDAFLPDTFASIKKCSEKKFNSVIENVKTIINYSNNPEKNILVGIRFIVLEENYREVDDFIQFWMEYCDDNNIQYTLVSGGAGAPTKVKISIWPYLGAWGKILNEDLYEDVLKRYSLT